MLNNHSSRDVACPARLAEHKASPVGARRELGAAQIQGRAQGVTRGLSGTGGPGDIPFGGGRVPAPISTRRSSRFQCGAGAKPSSCDTSL